LALKIPQLLVQYLYQNRRMTLPGLGIFTLDKSVVLPEEHDRVLLSMPNAVQFQNANIAAADKELISFICENTGKIRPLAISDLDSYLSLGTEMLNIGKPFLLEGIGTITKNKAGKFDFSPGEYSLIKENNPSHDHGKKKIYAQDKKQASSSAPLQGRSFLKLLVFIGALIVVAVGGWLMYKKNGTTVEKTADTTAIVQEQKPAASDSLTKDSTHRDTSKKTIDSAHPSPVNGEQPVNFKFVILATANKPHALKRYKQLISFDLKAHFYQKDSSFFKVYFQFPALAKDTLMIKDSLKRVYAHSVTIEQ
jgi:hypothetical protein